jgi:choline dehydrogenase-like flavoprotein
LFLTTDELKLHVSKKISVIIVGAGPAGITIAMELESLGVDSLLIEAGGFDFPDENGNDPYKGEVGERPYPLSASRLRFFGGTSNHWGGWCRPLDPEDFKKIEGIPLSGWPLSYQDAYSYLDRAHEICEIDGSDYDVSSLKSESIISFDSKAPLRTGLFKFSPPTRFGVKYRDKIAKSKKIHCALNINLLKIQRLDNVSSSLLVKLPTNEIISIKAKKTILAMGGIENARYLLSSNLDLSIPYGNDWIGRCFMEHYGFETSVVYAKKEMNYRRHTINKRDVKFVIAPSPSQIEKGISNLMMGLYPIKDDSFLRAEYSKNKGLFEPEMNKNNGWHYSLKATVGTRPNKNSRILLLDEKDINGVNRIKLDWQIPDEDFQSVMHCANMLGNYLGSNGTGRLKKTNYEIPEPDEMLSTGMHHIGTTRMSASPKTGVVDINCKVFNSNDLFIAGSSVFPTSGYSNPTLTIVALAVRLAHHIGGQLNGREV